MDKNSVAISEIISQVLKGNNKLIFKDFLDVSEAAAFLGVTKGWMYKLNYHKIIPYYKPHGKKIYYKREDLLSYLSGGKHYSSAELNERANEILKNLENV
ncbi:MULTISPECIES: helix-turn-helix domain-containing protein [Chryseobacterium]|uniref:helix-turn-helix domain-containing protein n=1 Tax=Chryseobacterium sp. R2A-55 TaxID=2744445 RepID=UPI001F48F7F6|nr:helix-turn-helix domain-containing protein [Chryseobacterium sp. R2A-55]